MSRQQKLPKESKPDQTGQGKKLFLALALQSTLLSSQRTTTHRKLAPFVGPVPPGHSFNFTRSSWPCQPVYPGWCLSALVHPPIQARSIAAIRSSKDLAGTAVSDLSAAVRFPAGSQNIT